jgi:hypothetical protein
MARLCGGTERGATRSATAAYDQCNTGADISTPEVALEANA